MLAVRSVEFYGALCFFGLFAVYGLAAVVARLFPAIVEDSRDEKRETQNWPWDFPGMCDHNRTHCALSRRRFQNNFTSLLQWCGSRGPRRARRALRAAVPTS